MRLVTHEALDRMKRSNRQLPSHINPAIIVIKMIHEKTNLRQFIGLKINNTLITIYFLFV